MRTLSSALAAAIVDGHRHPAYKLLAYDSTVDSISAIVCGTATQEPLDLTPYAKMISWQNTQMNFCIVDPGAVFHPDVGAQRNYLADGSVIRLLEGDSRIPQSEWVWTFTGVIRGQVGWQVNRAHQVMESQVTVYSRENTAAWKKRIITSGSYTVGTELGVVLRDILQDFMGLADAEIRVPPALGFQLLHQVTQVSDMTPWDMVTAILQAVAKTPVFDGAGKFSYIDKNLSRAADKVYSNYSQIQDYQIPARNQDAMNKVRVVFLDAVLSRVDNSYQKLGTAQVTTGFFSMGERLRCYWSEDRTQRASVTNLRVIKSVNSGLLPVGSESYTQVDEFHGLIIVSISKWVPILASVMLLEYLVAAIIPDDVLVFNIGWGVSVGEGFTISIGRILQAQALIVLLLIMMSMGSAQYEVWGTPYDYAYLQKTSTAVQAGIQSYEENELAIENNFLGSFDQADTIAINEWIWQKTIAIPRRLTVVDDLALETGDIVALPDGRKFLITGLSKTIQRGVVPMLALDGCKVLTI